MGKAKPKAGLRKGKGKRGLNPFFFAFVIFSVGRFDLSDDGIIDSVSSL